MTIKYNLTLEDLVAFNKYHTRHRSERRNLNLILRRWWWVCLFPLLAIILQWNALMGDPKARRFLIIGLVIVGIFFGILLIIHYIQSNALKNYYASNKGQFGDRTVSIGPDGLAMKSELGESNTPWKGVPRLEQDANHIFIYTNSVTAVVIPKRAFATLALAQEFYSEAIKLRSV